MSIARHHAEWLSLIDVSGPFLSMPVLLRVFPQGLVGHCPEMTRRLRMAYDEWEEERRDPAIHNQWIRFVMSEVLTVDADCLGAGQDIPQGLCARLPGRFEEIRPDLIVRDPLGTNDGAPVRLLISTWPPTQDLEKPVSSMGSGTSPASRMVLLLHATGHRIGLVTNGDQWMLVDAPPDETTGFASWYANLWLEEPLTLRAFVSLLGSDRFFGVAKEDALPGLLAESARDQHDVTDQLGLQVRNAVEVLIQSLDRADIDRDRDLLAGIDEKVLYEAALTVMMRLVFLFSAEERGLLLLGDPMYDQHYAVSTIREQLQDAADQHGEEILERRFDAWCRLLAAFRAVYGGIRHESFNLPAYGGNLFHPDRFPFLEGRRPGSDWTRHPAAPIPVNNRTALHLLSALQILQVRMPGGGPAEARKLSFRALDIEQIGHVYEGLLDHTARRAGEPILGLSGAKGKEPEIAVSRLDALREKGADDLVKFLAKTSGRSPAAIRRRVEDEDALDPDTHARLLSACGNDEALFQRVLPYANLLRYDTFGSPVVIPEGSVYVTAGADRRSSGTHYTPRSLTEPIVRHTLEPLVYDGPADGRPEAEWTLKSPKALLDLKICDMACGSGAFLVQACRYLSERLIEAWQHVEKTLAQPSAGEGALPVAPRITPHGEPSTGAADESLIPREADQRLIVAQRLIARQCLYGVDINPMACEMAKLSLWLLTLARNKPFTFLDHAIRRGDSLLGFANLEQLQIFDIRPQKDRKPAFFLQDRIGKRFLEAVGYRKKLEGIPDDSADALTVKAELQARAEAALSTVRTCCDYLVGAALRAAGKKKKDNDYEAHRQRCTWRIGDMYRGDWERDGIDQFRTDAREMLDAGKPAGVAPRRPFNWIIEFPEVFMPADGRFPETGAEIDTGFDAIIGNPPFMGGQKITGNAGTDMRNFLVAYVADGRTGSADLCAYFFLRAAQLLNRRGGMGLLSTNTIAQGDTREVGLDQLTANGFTLPRAVPSRKWPGVANLEVAHVWARRGKWRGTYTLNDKRVDGITSYLSKPGAVTGKPYRLAANKDKSFQGSIVLGMGFILEPGEAQDLIAKDAKNRDVLFPYLNGKDLNSRPDQSPSRWVINFFDWPRSREATGSWATGDEAARKEWIKQGVVPSDYPNPVAMDYPDCYQIVEEKVKPQRMAQNDAFGQRYWWRFLRTRPELQQAVASAERMLVRARIANMHSIAFLRTDRVFNEKIVVFSRVSFGILQSTIHELWARRYSSTLKKDMQYTPSDCFETFPLPNFREGSNDFDGIYHDRRHAIMGKTNKGLTATYNRFHDPDDRSAEISELRDLHCEMDRQVAAAYGWDDLAAVNAMEHGFHETGHGVRFSVSPTVRQDILDRLLALNHQRYKQEVVEGLHKKKKTATRSQKPKQLTVSEEPTLFG